MGIYEHQTQEIGNTFKELEDYKLKYYFKSLLVIYNKILSLLEYSDEELHKPLTDEVL